jgi:hypothetical protein
LTNVLEFITGSRPGFLEEHIVLAAKSVLSSVKKDLEKDMEKEVRVDLDSKKLIENCAFTHKIILIGDTTLRDTVEPKKIWSLKSTKCITSCACCFGENENSDEDAWFLLKKDQFLFDPSKSQKSKVE